MGWWALVEWGNLGAAEMGGERRDLLLVVLCEIAR